MKNKNLVSSLLSFPLFVFLPVAFVVAQEEIPRTVDLAGFSIVGAMLAFMATFFIVFAVIFVGIYIYLALALMAIAKKTNTEPAWLAWIPVANIYLLSKMAQMHWWPMLLMIGFFIPFVNIFAGIIFTIFSIIWYWKIFERVEKPGWWALMPIIPFVGAIVFFILLGIVAWGKNKTPQITSGPTTPSSVATR